jgi:BASS family bile acid:Na+ symporter
MPLGEHVAARIAEDSKMELLRNPLPIIVLIFVVSSMLAVGVSLTVGQILVPLRNLKLISLALLANFVLITLAALAIARLLRLNQSLSIGLILVSTAAGSPFLLKLARVAKADLAFAVGLMVILMVLTIGYLPMVLPLLLESVTVDPAKIGQTLVLLMFLPLSVGLLVKARYEAAAARVVPFLNKLSTFSFFLMVILISVTNIRNILDLFGTRGVLASILLVVIGSTIGWFVGGPETGTRKVMTLGTAQRTYLLHSWLPSKTLTIRERSSWLP